MSNDSEFEDSNSVPGGMSAVQKEVVYTKYLPYIDTLTCESEADEILSRIKRQLARSVHLRDVKVSGSHWVGQLTRYIRVYGRKFSKEDHILFVKLLYEIITTPDLEPNLFMKFTNILLTLLKKVELLSRDDLVLPWRPLLTVVKEIFFSSPMEQRLKLYPSNIELVVEKVVHSCQVYFAASETSEMLAEFRPLLCPYDTVMIEGVMYLEGFLPVHTAPHEHDISFKLWLPEFLDMWDSLHNSTQMNNTLVNLFSTLAVNNIGYIDWEPYIPKIFTQILRNFSLPIGSKISVTVGHPSNAFNEVKVTAWVASMLGGGSSTQHHIDQLFVALQSFYHPSNAGKWTGHLAKWLFRLPEAVVNRVHKERHADPTWQTPIPDTHKLTDDDITKFVLSMRSVAFMGIFSKVGSYEASQGVQSLAWLKPDLILPQLLETTYPALETLTEPHRLLSCINTIVGASRPLVASVDTFPEGRSHVLPLLNLCLPGIDPNDLKKSLVTLQMIGAFVMLVPIADSSHLLHTQTDLTDIERELCSASAQFEDFVLMFMDRIFVLIDNSASYDSNHQDNDPLAKLNPEMILLGHGLVYSFSVVLHQCSPQIYEVVLNRLHRFVQRSVYEVKIGGRFVGDLCRVAARVNPSAALAKFIPYLCTKIQDAINSHENILTEEQLDNELLWHLLILAKVVRCDGGEVVKYKDVLKTTIGSALRLKCRAGYTIASDLLQFTLTAFTTYYNLDYRHAYSDGGVTIRDWGRPGDIDNMKLRWHVPSTEEMATAQELVDTFLTPILAYLQNVPKQDTIDREELEKQLSMLAEILGGIAGAAPSLQGDQVLLRESQVPLTRVTYTCSCDNTEITVNGRNVRHVISDILTPLLSHMLEHCEGAIKCFNKVIKVYCTVLFYFGVLKEDFDARWKTYHFVKKQLEDKIIRKRSHTRMCLVTRIQLQHELRVLNNPKVFTATHQRLFTDIFTLSTSRYADVRKKAQTALFSGFNSYPYSYRCLMEAILANLRPGPDIPEYKFKGSLYIVKGQKKRCMATKLSWEVLHDMWPVIVQAQHSEKPSVQKIFDDILFKISENLETLSIHSTVSEGSLAAALLPTTPIPLTYPTADMASVVMVSEESLAAATALLPTPHTDTPADMASGVAFEQRVNQTNLKYYRDLEATLLALVTGGTLRWKFEEATLDMLTLLLRRDTLPSPTHISVTANKLISESQEIRTSAISSISTTLYILKRQRHKITTTLAEASGNDSAETDDDIRRSWHKYDSTNLPTTQDKWDQFVFVDKAHWGFTQWPREMLMLAPPCQQRSEAIPYDEYSDAEKVMYDFFMEEKNVEKVMEYLSMERGKKVVKFRRYVMELFKGMFCNYDDKFLEPLKPHVERLIADIDPSRIVANQHCVMEVLCGLIRGSKAWPFYKLESMWAWVLGLFKKIIPLMSAETLTGWKKFFTLLGENRDPRRYFWLYEFVVEAPLSGEGGSFGDHSRLVTLIHAMLNQEWKVASLHQRVIATILPNLGHAYNIVRDTIAMVLGTMYMFDYSIAGHKVDRHSLSRKDLIAFALPQLEILKYESPSQYNIANNGKSKSPITQQTTTNSHSATQIEKTHSSNHQKMETITLGQNSTMTEQEIMILRENMEAMLEQTAGLTDAQKADMLKQAEAILGGKADIEGVEIMEVGQGAGHTAMDTGNGDESNDEEMDEHKHAVRICKTMLQFIANSVAKSITSCTPEMISLMPIFCAVCKNDAETDDSLKQKAAVGLACLAQCYLHDDTLPVTIATFDEISTMRVWHARLVLPLYMQITVFQNLFLINQPSHVDTLKSLLLRLICDEQLEVRECSGEALSGLVQCGYLQEQRSLMQHFMKLSRTRLNKKRPTTSSNPATTDTTTTTPDVTPPAATTDTTSAVAAATNNTYNSSLIKRHAGVLGLCALVQAYPYDVPQIVPEILMVLSNHIHDPQPIQTTVNKTLNNFRRTHHDNWHDHKQKFTDDQLVILTDLLVSPNYYA